MRKFVGLIWIIAIAGFEPVAASVRIHDVGSLPVHACRQGRAYCGDLDRPLDPTGIVPGRISIHFEFYPHRDTGAARGTLVATEGGPGYPATESRADYLHLFAPLRGRRDVLLMDNRGTGRSGAVDCPSLQSAPQWTVDAVAACGASLGARAPLYSSAYAADDLAALLDALGMARIDLYGDSYGTYFAQVFALRHPARLRSIVLDGAYALNGPDYAWYPTYAPAMRDKFNLSCARSPACAALPGSSIDHLLPALESLRKAPFAASGVDDDGQTRRFEANPAALAIVLFGSAPALATTREADAAARAFVAGDRAPLLRLMAETYGAVDSRDPSADSRQWSAGLAAAVMCQDPPQIFDMRLPAQARLADRDRALAARRQSDPATYAPFTIDEYRGMPLDYAFLDQCVAWPAADAAHPAAQVVPRGAAYPDIPALVISGELDNMTTPADGAAVARAFPHGRQIVIANSFHVNALPRARSGCAASLVRRFIATLDAGNSGCAAEVPPLRLTGSFARRASELAPLEPAPGNAATIEQLQLANAAVQTIADVLARSAPSAGAALPGLRGGSYRGVTHGPNLHVSLYDVRWTEDVAVAGAVERPLGGTGAVNARVQVATGDLSQGPLRAAPRGTLAISWPSAGADARVTVRGTIDGVALAGSAAGP